MPRTTRTDRSAQTRERILDAAERLFAEHGVHEVSNRQIAAAAGQGNNAVVGYHLGTKADLVRAIIRRRSGEIERLRAHMVAQVPERAELRDWVGCLVRPSARHLDELGNPSFYARFAAQLMPDPALRALIVDEALSSASLKHVLVKLDHCVSLPPAVRLERAEMGHLLLGHALAERERALATGTPTPRATWDDAADALVDALVGIWLAPVTEVRR